MWKCPPILFKSPRSGFIILKNAFDLQRNSIQFRNVIRTRECRCEFHFCIDLILSFRTLNLLVGSRSQTIKTFESTHPTLILCLMFQFHYVRCLWCAYTFCAVVDTKNNIHFKIERWDVVCYITFCECVNLL